MSSSCECGCGLPTTVATRSDTRWGVVKGQPRRFLRGHSGHKWEPGYGAKPEPRLPDDWRARITLVGECWQWQGRINDQGYALYGTQRVHRLVYIALVGEIPDGLVLDHVCHSRDTTCPGGPPCCHRACVNPAHLEAITHLENVRRGRGGESARRRLLSRTHCANGHEWTAANTIQTPRQRKCRECRRQESARNNARRRGRAA